MRFVPGEHIEMLGLEMMALALEGLRALFQKNTEVYKDKKFQSRLCQMPLE